MPASTVNHRRTTLVERSLAVIQWAQSPSGAYLAAPTFPTYRYSWFRDGAFIADAADEWGLASSAAAFHSWVLSVLGEQLPSLEYQAGTTPQDDQVLHTRYQADGTTGSEEWPNFQLDGFGTWLWAYGRHVERGDAQPTRGELATVRDLANYLSALWPQPNFDCWEENSDRLHPSTLGAIYAGLNAAAGLLGEDRYAGVASAVRAYLLTHGVSDGHFSKHVGSSEVDANLVWLALPYEVVPVDDPRVTATLEELRRVALDPEGGLHRYRHDTYYGGGSWPLLTADLAQLLLARGEVAEAQRLLGWIEAQASTNGDLPEQAETHLLDPSRLAEWQGLWGISAKPLVWTHAAYLRLLKAFERGGVTP